MSWYKPTSILDKLFASGVLIKGASGLVELFGALLLVFIQPDSIRKMIAFVTQRELQQDPQDLLANILVRLTEHLNVGSKWFAVIYLAIHGTIKLVAVFGILKNQLWAYPFSLITLGGLMIYQILNIIVHPTVGVIALTIFDAFVLWLIWREYNKIRA